MSIRLLPELRSSEGVEIYRNYTGATPVMMDAWVARYNYSTRRVFQKAVRKIYGISHKSKQSSQSTQNIREDVIVNLPPINIIHHEAKVKSDADISEDQIVHFSDGHAGKITQSYNKIVYRARMETAYESMLTIADLHREIYPINRLHVFITGDNVQGENPHQGSKVGEVEMGARDQVKYIAAPAWNDFIGSARQHYDEVNVWMVPGNHGGDKLAPETSNWDLLLADILEAGIGRERGVNIHISNRWSAVVRILGWRCFLFHGDGIPCQQGVPFFALDKKLKSWYMTFGGFSYAFSGHFHKRHSDEISTKLEYFMCGSLVSDDDWATKKLGISSNPSQWTFGIHPKNGITFRYPLIVDYKYLPEQNPNPEATLGFELNSSV